MRVVPVLDKVLGSLAGRVSIGTKFARRLFDVVFRPLVGKPDNCCLLSLEVPAAPPHQSKIKVNGSKTHHISLCTHLLFDMKQPIMVRWLADPNCDHNHFSHNFWTSYEYLIYCQSKDCYHY